MDSLTVSLFIPFYPLLSPTSSPTATPTATPTAAPTATPIWFEQIPRFMCDYEHVQNVSIFAGGRGIPANHNIDVLKVGQSLEIEFYFMVESTVCADPGGFCSILHVGKGLYESTPGLWVTADGTFVLNMQDNNNMQSHGFTIGAPGLGRFEYENLADGRIHIFYLKFTFTQISVEIDNKRAYTGTGNYVNNQRWADYPVYLGDPWYYPAQWTVCNFCIYSDAPTGAPSPAPTDSPTGAPTPAPSNPTSAPTPAPTPMPTPAPTPSPTPKPTNEPTAPTLSPTTHKPTRATASPTVEGPTLNPTREPTPDPAMTFPPTPAPTLELVIVADWDPNPPTSPPVEKDDLIAQFLENGIVIF